MIQEQPDASIANHGNIVLLTPLTQTAQEWIKEHLPEEVLRFAGAIAIEPRYVDDIIHGMTDSGLTISIN